MSQQKGNDSAAISGGSKTRLKTFVGSITDLEVDAIINAANNELWMGSGVAGAIRRQGGVEIETEAMSKGPVEVGQAVITGAGRLKAQYVIHAVAMGQDLKTSASFIETATRNTLERAHELGIKTIAFPALGTGVGGFPIDQCARIMVGAARRFLKERSSILKEIWFAVMDPKTAAAFEDAIREAGD
ncbi:MAG: macro domain-containing protein [Acidobacteria bacterium]|nr:macro domain-containing protein [Acidobacteriota bacterium]